jgi:hypothetical protein
MDCDLYVNNNKCGIAKSEKILTLNVTDSCRQNLYLNNNSIQFNWYLLTCRLSSTNTYYKVSTKTQIKHKKTVQIHKNKTLNRKTKTILQKKGI